MVDTIDKVSSSNSHDDIIATHQLPSTDITIAPSTTINKRKLDTTSSNTNDTTTNDNPLPDEGPPSSSSNKRRKKYKKKKNKGKQQQNNNKSKKQQQHAKYIKKQHNWIESCSESIHRIPANCVAPLTCIVTRVEIEEEALLPKGKVDTSIDNTSSGVNSGKVGKSNDIIKPSSIQVETDAKKQQPNNIARPTQAFLSQYSKNREPWKILSTMQVDNEEKKVFIPVKRHSSTVGPTEWTKRRKRQQQSGSSKNTYVHLPNGNNGDGILNPYPTSVVPDKFWAQRKRLFSKYDEGIQIHSVDDNDDGEMWYSVTPESIANHVADKMINMILSQGGHQQSASSSSSIGGSITVLDVFCGCGGNSIAFARLNTKKKEGKYPRVKVIAVDNNLSRLKMAANNAAIYKIDKNDIIFIHADAVQVLNHFNKGKLIDTKSSRQYESHQYAGYKLGGLDLLPNKLDGIFLSPPWGGTEYAKQEAGKSGFDIITSIVVESSCLGDEMPDSDGTSTTTAVKTNGGELLSLTAKAVLNDESTTQEGVIAYFLPRNTDGIILGQSAISSDINGTFEMEQNVVNGKVKTITAYFGSGVDDKQGD